MKQLLSVIIAICIFINPYHVFAEEMSLAERAEMLSSVLLMYGASSVQYAIIDNGEIVLSGGTAKEGITPNPSVDKDLMYGIGSISKVYTTAAAMILVDQGLLDIDTPIVEYIPDFTMQDDRYKQITARMLMNHSSGFYGTLSNNAFLFGDNSTYARDNFLYNLSQQTLKAEPAAFSVYSNDSFTMLEILIERISGMSFTEFLHANIFEPMGFENTKTPLDDFDRSRIATTFMNIHDIPTPTDTLNLIGTGGLYSTAEEVVKFAEVLMGNQEHILSAQSAKAMQQEEYRNGFWVSESNNNIGFGLGWDSVNLYPFGEYGIQALSKGGDTLMFHSTLVALPEYNIAMAVSSSGGLSVFNNLFASNILQQLLLEKEIIDDIVPNIVLETPIQQEMPEFMQEYSGIYATSAASLPIILEDNYMTIIVETDTDVIEQRSPYIGNGQFQFELTDMIFSFVEHDDTTYLQATSYSDIPQLGTLVQTYFDSQKLDPNPLDETLHSIWEERAGKLYFLVNEKATSQYYFAPNAVTRMEISIDLENGYLFGGNKIIDENNTTNVIQIPVVSGRDTLDMSFYTENNINYLKMNDFILISEDHLYPLFNGTSVCTILENGHARWYKIDENTANNIIHVNIPENGAFAVYTEDGNCIEFSTVSGNNTSLLPENGTIVFIGDPNSVFEISITPNVD